MIRATLLIALCGVGPVMAQAGGATQITCTEKIGGWCESNGNCYENTKTSADFVISMSRQPMIGETIAGTLTECREGKCGYSWDKEITNGLGNRFIVKGQGETFIISSDTGFFTHSSTLSSTTLGRVSHTFGLCRLPERR